MICLYISFQEPFYYVERDLSEMEIKTNRTDRKNNLEKQKRRDKRVMEGLFLGK
jgi:hypothetical protein